MNFFRFQRVQKVMLQTRFIMMRKHLLPIDQIEFKVRDKGLKKYPPGTVLDGDWDLNGRAFSFPFCGAVKMDAVHQRYVENIPWEETRLFKEACASRFRSGEKIAGCVDLSSLLVKYQKYDRLFLEFKKGDILVPSLKHPWIDPFVVHVGRDNNVIWTATGNHRLALACAAGVTHVPVIVWLIHAQASNPFLNLKPILR